MLNQRLLVLLLLQLLNFEVIELAPRKDHLLELHLQLLVDLENEGFRRSLARLGEVG